MPGLLWDFPNAWESVVCRALALFYESNTYQYLRQKIGDLHCMSDNYLIDELIIEYTGKQGS